MLNKIRNRQGFTLIELLIVVAIIGILAAVAIPQFAAYRMRGFNSAAVSDLKNAKAAQEALFTDFQVYGKTPAAAAVPGGANLTTAVGAFGNGVQLTGALTAATANVAGAYFDGTDAGLNVRAVGFGLSNNVAIQAASGTADPATTYNMITKHTAGNRLFFSEAESTAILLCENQLFAGEIMNVGANSAAAYGAVTAAITTGQDVVPGPAGTACGGAPVAQWNAM
jgi:type IV pilus assembly protein PilA